MYILTEKGLMFYSYYLAICLNGESTLDLYISTRVFYF